MAAPAFPVDAAIIVSMLASIARLMTMALARSLNEALGLLLSSLQKAFAAQVPHAAFQAGRSESDPPDGGVCFQNQGQHSKQRCISPKGGFFALQNFGLMDLRELSSKLK
jgi:hypothetical protein